MLMSRAAALAATYERQNRGYNARAARRHGKRDIAPAPTAHSLRFIISRGKVRNGFDAFCVRCFLLLFFLFKPSEGRARFNGRFLEIDFMTLR